MTMLQYSIHLCGFLMLVGSGLMPNVLQGHGEVKVDIMLLLVANCWTRSFALGYWLFYFSSVFRLRWGKKILTGKRLSQVSMYFAFLPLPVLRTVNDVTVGSFIVSNQLVAGSIMVRHMISIIVLSLPLRVYCLMRSTPNACRGVVMNSFDVHGCTFGCVGCFWQDLQDLTLLDSMCKLFQYIMDFVVSLRLKWPGCWR